MSDVTPHLRYSEALRGKLYMMLQALRGRPFGRFMREIQVLENLASAEFDRFVESQLTGILDYAKRHVPFYQAGDWQGSAPGGFTALATWPVLEKDHLRSDFDALLAQPQPRNTLIQKTSGSTGSPVRVAMTYEADAWGWAEKYAGRMRYGIPVGARSLRLSHDSRPLRDFLLGQKSVPSLASDEMIDAALDYLRRHRPTLVVGPPSALFNLARHFRERGVRSPLVPFARVGGEQLYAFQRTAIESSVAETVVNSYACTETGALAYSCRVGSMHVCADHVFLEIFVGDRPAEIGDFGDIVATSLRNKAMPLVRYRVGDRGRLSTEKCPCGAPQPVLYDLQARSQDQFQAPDGEFRHGSEIVSQLDGLYADAAADSVRQVQFVQKSPTRWEALVETSSAQHAEGRAPNSSRVIAETLTGIVQRTFGQDCKVETMFVDAIPRVRGKLRYYHGPELTDT
jgi:phenylacetate-CoA ligase